MPSPKLLYSFCLLLFLMVLSSCGSRPKTTVINDEIPSPPDYSKERYWAALPWREDAADALPEGLTDAQTDAPVDVFFLHPTTYTERLAERPWNASVDDDELRKITDESPIQYQASIFNGAGRVFAPYYRQAHLQTYFSPDTAGARRAFDLAYSDVRAAFQYYLDLYNEGRPIIIAAHSQGATHAKRLVREFFDGRPLQKKLVAAYLVGMPVERDYFQSIPPCRDSTDTGCVVSWRTYRRGAEPSANRVYDNLIVTNPLTWTTDTTYADASLNLGAVIRPFGTVRPGANDAQVYGSILWASKPRFPGSLFFNRTNYHIGDFNLFYLNVRENARLRVEHYLAKQP